MCLVTVNSCVIGPNSCSVRLCCLSLCRVVEISLSIFSFKVKPMEVIANITVVSQLFFFLSLSFFKT